MNPLRAAPPATTWPPDALHLLAKPTGAICNLDCQYCYFLTKAALYPGSHFRMTPAVLEAYVREYVAAQRVPEASFGWQGGEPTLMGRAFFEEVVRVQARHRPAGLRLRNTLQTNGTLLDDAWCAFFKEQDFLIGLSLDGPQPLHDTYRVNKGGQPTFAQVWRAVELLKKHGVEFNILTTLNAANGEHPLAVYRFLRDEVETRFIQFIPIVEHAQPGAPGPVTERSLTGEQYGRFLNAVFDEWVRRDVGRVYVQMFDVALAKWLGEPSGLCVHEATCGAALALEHNGDVYSCDHFVEPRHRLGNLTKTPLRQLAASGQQRRFGKAKRDSLPRYCRKCDVRFACHGGCPKDRLLTTPAGEPGLNYLCAGYQAFFRHTAPAMRFMAQELRAGRPPANIMAHLTEQESQHAR